MTGQEELNSIIFKHNIVESWIAEKLHISPQRLNYQLHGAKSISYEYYSRIKNILKDAGILTNTPDECKELTKLAFDFSQVIGSHLNLISKEIKKDIEDNVIDLDERMRLKYYIEDARKDITAKLDLLNELVDSKKEVNRNE